MKQNVHEKKVNKSKKKDNINQRSQVWTRMWRCSSQCKQHYNWNYGQQKHEIKIIINILHKCLQGKREMDTDNENSTTKNNVKRTRERVTKSDEQRTKKTERRTKNEERITKNEALRTMNVYKTNNEKQKQNIKAWSIKHNKK